MESLQQCVKEYTELVQAGRIATAYKGIMTFMTGLERFLAAQHPECNATALYFGYMDMTYFAFTPPVLAAKKLNFRRRRRAGRFQRAHSWRFAYAERLLMARCGGRRDWAGDVFHRDGAAADA